MTIDPTVWKDLPIAIAILLFVLGMTKLGFDGVKYVIEFLKSRDAEYNANTKRLIADQDDFWRLFSEKQSQVWQAFVRDMVIRVGDGQDSVMDFMSKNFRDLSDRVDKIGRELNEHDKRTNK